MIRRLSRLLFLLYTGALLIPAVLATYSGILAYDRTTLLFLPDNSTHWRVFLAFSILFFAGLPLFAVWAWYERRFS